MKGEAFGIAPKEGYNSILEKSEVYKRYSAKNKSKRAKDFDEFQREILLRKKLKETSIGDELKLNSVPQTSIDSLSSNFSSLSFSQSSDTKTSDSEEPGDKLKELEERYIFLVIKYLQNSGRGRIISASSIEGVSIAIRLHKLNFETNDFDEILRRYNEYAMTNFLPPVLPNKLLEILRNEDLVGSAISEKFKNFIILPSAGGLAGPDNAQPGLISSIQPPPPISPLITQSLWGSSSSSSSSITYSTFTPHL